jgi:anti-sigma factor RsiW
MKQDAENEGTLTRYLLGELDAEARSRTEERLLTDDQFYDELLASEDELVDRYLSDLLSAPERVRFADFFLSTPERQQKLRFARAFKQYVSLAAIGDSATETTGERARPADDVSHHPSWRESLSSLLHGPRAAWGLALAATLLVLVCGGFWWLMNSPHDGASDVASDSVQTQNVFAVTLTPGLTRDTVEMKRVEIPAHAATVRLRLETVGERDAYRAVLQSFDGNELRSQDRLKAEAASAGRIVNFDLPARLFKSSDYQVKLTSSTNGGDSEDVARYVFRVVVK